MREPSTAAHWFNASSGTVQFNFDSDVMIEEIRLRDRPFLGDHLQSVKITFSDGTSIIQSGLLNFDFEAQLNVEPNVIKLDTPVMTDFVQIEILSGTGGAGFSWVQIFGWPVAWYYGN